MAVGYETSVPARPCRSGRRACLPGGPCVCVRVCACVCMPLRGDVSTTTAERHPPSCVPLPSSAVQCCTTRPPGASACTNARVQTQTPGRAGRGGGALATGGGRRRGPPGESMVATRRHRCLPVSLPRLRLPRVPRARPGAAPRRSLHAPTPGRWDRPQAASA